MPSGGRTNPLQDLVDRGQAACQAEEWFEAERLLDRALTMSHGRRDFSDMVEILEALAHARAGRRRLALASRAAVRIIDDAVTDTMELERGRYLVQPPLVGADARRLRLLALSREIPVIVACREPRTQLGMIPIVAIGPVGAVRTRVQPPAKEDRPSAGWMRDALLELGAAAVASVDPGHAAERRLEQVIGLIDTLPEDDSLHQLGIELCHAAEQEAAGR